MLTSKLSEKYIAVQKIFKKM